MIFLSLLLKINPFGLIVFFFGVLPIIVAFFYVSTKYDWFHRFQSQKNPQVDGYGFYGPYTQKNLAKAKILLGVEMTKKESHDLKAQLQYLSKYLDQKFPSFRVTNRHVMGALKNYYDTDSVIYWIRRKMPKKQHVQILDFMMDLAFYNQRLSKGELQFLKEVALKLRINQETFDALYAIRLEQYESFHRWKKEEQKKATQKRRAPSRREKALKLLGFSGNPSPEEIKKRYRQLAKKFHPDRFVRMGEDELKMANERFAAINHAYDVLTE